MKKTKIRIALVALLLAAFVVLAVCTSYIAPLDEKGSPILTVEEAGTENYLDQHWDEMMQEAESNAIDLATLLKEANGDLNTVASQYCTGDGANFTVHGTVKVLEANTDSRAGYLVIEPEGGAEGYTLHLQIGPVFKGSSVRDSFTCIGFSDFPNQMDWSALSSEIMQRITQNELSQWDMSSLTGKEIEFLGCFTLGSSDTLMITPITFSVL